MCCPTLTVTCPIQDLSSYATFVCMDGTTGKKCLPKVGDALTVVCNDKSNSTVVMCPTTGGRISASLQCPKASMCQDC